MNFVPNVLIYDIPALVQIMAWRRPGDEPSSEPIVVYFTDAYMVHSASMSYGPLPCIKGIIQLPKPVRQRRVKLGEFRHDYTNTDTGTKKKSEY